MIIVNTKNRSMPHPLQNFKFNSKMKCFTNVWKNNGNLCAYLKSFAVVFLSLLASLTVDAQCVFKPMNSHPQMYF